MSEITCSNVQQDFTPIYISMHYIYRCSKLGGKAESHSTTDPDFGQIA